MRQTKAGSNLSMLHGSRWQLLLTLITSMEIPSFTNRMPNEIIENFNYFESSGRTFKALSWLDYARKKTSVSALEYAALETRLAIEQLIFEQLVVGVGTALDAKEYKKCRGDAGKLSAMINRLVPKYEKLVNFTKKMAPPELPITKWDNRKLDSYSGRVSQYLHWSGGLDVTIQSMDWFNNGMAMVGEAANYIWHGLTNGNTGVMAIGKLEPELLELWDLYADNQISLEDVVARADLIEPVLQARLSDEFNRPNVK